MFTNEFNKKLLPPVFTDWVLLDTVKFSFGNSLMHCVADTDLGSVKMGPTRSSFAFGWKIVIHHAFSG